MKHNIMHYITLHCIALYHNVVLRPIDISHCIVRYVCYMRGEGWLMP